MGRAPRFQIHQPPAGQVAPYDLLQVQQRMLEWSERLKTLCPILDGVFLETSDGSETIPLTTTATDYAHKLGRKWRGYIITYQSAAFVIFATKVSDDADAKFIRLDAGGTTDAHIWVF